MDLVKIPDLQSYKSAKVTFSESLDSLPHRIVFEDEMLSSMPDS